MRKHKKARSKDKTVRIYKLIKQAYFDSVYDNTISGFRIGPLVIQCWQGETYMCYYGIGEKRIERHYTSVFHVLKFIDQFNFFYC